LNVTAKVRYNATEIIVPSIRRYNRGMAAPATARPSLFGGD
jgi:hypothetical protein